MPLVHVAREGDDPWQLRHVYNDFRKLGVEMRKAGEEHDQVAGQEKLAKLRGQVAVLLQTHGQWLSEELDAVIAAGDQFRADWAAPILEAVNDASVVELVRGHLDGLTMRRLSDLAGIADTVSKRHLEAERTQRLAKANEALYVSGPALQQRRKGRAGFVHSPYDALHPQSLAMIARGEGSMGSIFEQLCGNRSGASWGDAGIIARVATIGGPTQAGCATHRERPFAVPRVEVARDAVHGADHRVTSDSDGQGPGADGATPVTECLSTDPAGSACPAVGGCNVAGH